MINIDDIIAANGRIKTKPHKVLQTPLEKSLALSALYGVNIFLKLENLQLTGSFKLRGATNKIASLNTDKQQNGIITASSGNHGLGVAMAASLMGIQADIYVPENVSTTKLDAIKQLGANAILVDGDSYLAETIARAQSETSGKAYISPYNDEAVICGQASVGVEIMAQNPHIDAIFVAVGGGGLIGGIGTYAKSIKPEVEIVACWPDMAKSFYHALEEGKIYDVEEGATLSDGTAGGVEHDAITLEICQKIIDLKILVSEDEIATAMRLIAESDRHIIEGSAGVAVAGALQAIKAEPQKYKNKNIAIVVCGRNISFEKFMSVVAN